MHRRSGLHQHTHKQTHIRSFTSFMQNHSSLPDDICVPYYIALVFAFPFVCDGSECIASLQVTHTVMMKRARVFGLLFLRRQEAHWISWINEWIKILSNHTSGFLLPSPDYQGISVSHAICKQTHIISRYTLRRLTMTTARLTFCIVSVWMLLH